MRQDNAIVFIDFLFLLLTGFVGVLILIIVLINPPAKNQEFVPPGTLIVEANWTEGEYDVDLWLSDPSGEVVSYSNKNGRIWDLLRDDLGTQGDLTPYNREFAVTRGLPNGEYQINVHLFAIYGSGHPPLNVYIEIYMQENSGRKALVSKPLVFRESKQEIPVASITIQDGRPPIVNENTHRFLIPQRSK